MCNWNRWILPGLLTVGLLSLLALWTQSGTIESDLKAKSESALGTAGMTWAAVEMDGRDAVVSGLAPSENARSQAFGLVEDAYDVRVVDNRTDLMQSQSPYVFSAEKSGNKITLSGFFPDEATRETVLADVNSAVQQAEIQDNTQLARGASENFADMTEFSFRQLFQLQNGKFEWKDDELTISGQAVDQDAYKNVNTALAGDFPDQSSLSSAQIIAPSVSPYTWSVEFDQSRATVSGHVPREEARKKILSDLGSSPGLDVTDRQTVASGEPEEFDKAVEFVLQQVPRLSNGSAELSDLRLSIRGVGRDAASYEAAKTAVTGQLPAGLILQSEAISPASVSPYRWSATYNGNLVTLSGFVPDAQSRETVVAAAKSSLPDISIEDEMQIADGAPGDFTSATQFALQQLPRFTSGKVSLSDLELAVEGVAMDPAAFKAAKQSVADDLPTSLALGSSRILPAKISPFRWSGEYDGQSLRLGGFVSDSAARTAIVETANRILPQATIDDEMQIADGAPEGFQKATEFALEQLQRFTSGSVSLVDFKLRVEGVASDPENYEQAKTAVIAQLPTSMSLVRERIQLPVISPYRWAADYDGKKLALNGFVPNESVRQSILRVAEKSLPDTQVEDRMDLAAGAPKGFAGAANFALRQLQRLKSGFVSLSALDLTVKGEAVDPRSYSIAKRQLQGDLPLSLNLAEEEITAAEVSPYPWTAGYNGKRVLLAGNVPSEDDRRTLIEQAKDALPDTEIVDRMMIAKGAPDGYGEAASSALSLLPRFSQGRVGLSDLELTISGRAISPADYETAEDYAAGDLPASMTIASSTIVPPRATGDYLWQATMSPEAVVLEGSAPNKQARIQIEERARQSLPDREIDNRMVIETGAPGGFLAMASRSMRLLQDFSDGSASIRNRDVSISGKAKTALAFDKATALTSKKAPLGYNWDEVSLQPPEVSPYSWSVQNTSDTKQIDGFAPDKSVASQLAELTGKTLGTQVTDSQRIGGGAPEGFQKAGEALIASVSSLENSKGTITDTTVTIEGRAYSEAEADKIASDLEVALPSSFNLRNRIVYPQPRVEQQAETTTELKQVESEAAPKKEQEQQVAKAEPEPAPKVAAKCDVDFKSLFRGEKILFETARAVILEESEALLSRIADGAKKCEGAVIEVGGHTDSRGSQRYNLKLSQERASAVVDYLTGKGIPAERLVAKGYGESKPIASNRRPETRSKNRRIEFKVLEDG